MSFVAGNHASVSGRLCFILATATGPTPHLIGRKPTNNLKRLLFYWLCV